MTGSAAMVLFWVGLGVFGVVVFALCIAAFRPLHNTHQKRQRQQWARMAQQLGLTLKLGQWHRNDTIEGDVGGVWVRIDMHEVSDHEYTSITYTRVRTYHRPRLGLGLEIHRTKLRGGLVTFLDPERKVKTGDAAFDNAYTVHARDEAQVLRLLTPSVRQQICAYEHAIGPVTLDDACVTFSFKERAHHAAQIQPIIDHQRALIAAVRRAQHSVDAPSAAVASSWERA